MTQELSVIIRKMELKELGYGCIATIIEAPTYESGKELPDDDPHMEECCALYTRRLDEAYVIINAPHSFAARNGLGDIISAAPTKERAYEIIDEFTRRIALRNAKAYNVPIIDKTIPAWMQMEYDD